MERVKILFLDVDGVLNNTKTKERCGYETGIEHSALLLLKQIIQTTSAKICLISSWKEYWYKYNKVDQDEMANYLDDKLMTVGLEIWDKTKEVESRGKEINNFINTLPEKQLELESFVILDDEWLDYEKEGLADNLIFVDYREGLTGEESQEAIKMLN